MACCAVPRESSPHSGAAPSVSFRVSASRSRAARSVGEDGRFAIWSAIEISRHRSSLPAAVKPSHPSLCTLGHVLSSAVPLVDILSIDPRRNNSPEALAAVVKAQSHTQIYAAIVSGGLAVLEGWLSQDEKMGSDMGKSPSGDDFIQRLAFLDGQVECCRYCPGIAPQAASECTRSPHPAQTWIIMPYISLLTPSAGPPHLCILPISSLCVSLSRWPSLRLPTLRRLPTTSLALPK